MLNGCLVNRHTTTMLPISYIFLFLSFHLFGRRVQPCTQGRPRSSVAALGSRETRGFLSFRSVANNSFVVEFKVH